MFFNHKLKKITGSFERISLDKKKKLRELVDAGIMESTEHPSDDMMEAARKYRLTHVFNEGVFD